jgi:NADP-dependent 3-hydroxy acid dehydrogenase YdfG/uncharacterized cupin superfamily protein
MSFAVDSSSLKVDLSPVRQECRVPGAQVPDSGALQLPCNFLDCGVWEHTAGESCDIEVDEVFVVVEGRATVTKSDGSQLHLKPGSIGVLKAGDATKWTIESPLKKVWITPTKPNKPRRVAIVTGCGNKGGIGYACAAALIRDGYSVVVSSTTERIQERVLDLIAETGANQDRIKGAHFDLTKPAAPAALVSFASSHFGGIDVVVNNAGMTSVSQSSASESGALCGVSRESWRLSMARNVETAVFVTQAALPHLQKSSAGRVIVISSITGPVMCAAKQFLSSLLLQTKKSKSSRKQSGRCRMRWHMQLPKLDSAVLFAHLLWILGRQVQLFT